MSADFTSLEELRKDHERVEWLETQRRHYSRPPMRAVTGWQWSVIDEAGHQTAREAIDAAMKQSAE